MFFSSYLNMKTISPSFEFVRYGCVLFKDYPKKTFSRSLISPFDDGSKRDENKTGTDDSLYTVLFGVARNSNISDIFIPCRSIWGKLLRFYLVISKPCPTDELWPPGLYARIMFLLFLTGYRHIWHTRSFLDFPAIHLW